MKIKNITIKEFADMQETNNEVVLIMLDNDKLTASVVPKTMLNDKEAASFTLTEMFSKIKELERK